MTYFLQNTFNDLLDDIINTNYQHNYNQSEVINSKLETKINIEVPGFKKENLNLLNHQETFRPQMENTPFLQSVA